MVIFPSIRRKYMVNRIPKGATVAMSDCVVALASDSVVYTGSARTVVVTVAWQGATLAVNTDYTLSWSNNTNVGPATVTVTGMGQFSGSVTKTFHIVPGTGGTWGDIDLANATLLSTTSSAGSGSDHPFCLRGGYVFSATSGGNVHRYSYTQGEWTFTDDNLSTTSNGYASGFCVSRDGCHSYMYIGYSGYYTIYMYDHTTAWDLSNATDHYYNHGICTPYTIPSKSGWSDHVHGVDISEDGRTMITLKSSGYLHSHKLNTPFDVSSARSDEMVLKDLDVLAGVNYFRGMQVAPDGKRMVTISGDGILRMWNIAIPWDVSTVTGVASSFDTGLGSLTFQGVGITDDCTHLLLKTSGSPTIKVYQLVA